MSTLEWTLGSIVIVLALIAVIGWLGRDRKNRRFKIGVFLERERFNHKEDDDDP